jgi:urea transporter
MSFVESTALGARRMPWSRLAPPPALQVVVAEAKRLAADVGQTFFVNDARVGVAMFVGLACVAPRAAAYAAAGTVIADVVGRRLRPNKKVMLAGALGLNGFFAGLVASTLFTGSGSLVALALGAPLAALVAVLAPRVLGQWQLPPLAIGYVVAMWLVWAARVGASTLMEAPYLEPTPVAAVDLLTTLGAVARGVGGGMAQVFFQSDWRFGFVMLAVLALLQRRTAAWVLCGCFVGAVVAALLGAPLGRVAAGYYGFSPALAALGYLTMVAPAAARNDARGWRKVLAPVILTQALAVVLTLGLAQLLAALGLPALALPYIVAIWLAALAQPVVDASAWSPRSWN